MERRDTLLSLPLHLQSRAVERCGQGGLDVGEHWWEFGATPGSLSLLIPSLGEKCCSSSSVKCLDLFLRVRKNIQSILFSSLNGYNLTHTKVPVGGDSEVASQGVNLIPPGNFPQNYSRKLPLQPPQHPFNLIHSASSPPVGLSSNLVDWDYQSV